MWKFKSCPRCKGDLYVDRDSYGWYQGCMQCGYLKDLSNLALSSKQPKKEQQERVLLAVS
jgi:DNA-directed RNA polymerase subunit M/transcription elongation factor TFIIS